MRRLRKVCDFVPPTSVQQLRGLMTGKIDLVFEHAGRFHVLDYKSNRLGSATRLSDYAAPQLERAMADDHYRFQALLYTVAVDRFLRQRIPGYRRDRLGEAIYLFVRAAGIAPDIAPRAGIWTQRFDDALIDAVDDPRLSLYLYHIPQFSGVAISADVVARLAADFPRTIAGVKDSGGDFAHTETLLAAVPRLAILVGHEPHLPKLMRAGGAGTICGIANLFPRLVAPLLEPNVTQLDQERIAAFIEAVFRFPFLPAFKAVRAAQTNDATWRTLRPPLFALNENDRVRLFAALAAVGFSNGTEIER